MVEVACAVCGDLHDHTKPCDASPSDLIPVDEAWEGMKAGEVDVDEMVEELLEEERAKQKVKRNSQFGASATEPPPWMTGMTWENAEPEKVEMTFDPEELAAHTHSYSRTSIAGRSPVESQHKPGAALGQNLTSPIERAAKRLAEEDDDPEPEEVGSCPMCGATVTDDNDARVESSAGGVYCDVECYNDLVGP